jgi:hypothetical protein
MGDEEKMKAVNQLVTAMVKENYSLDEIAKELSNSDDPAEKMWAQSYGKTAPTTSPANLSILDRAKKHLEETSGYQLAAEGIGLAVTPPIATHLGRRIIDKILPSPGVLVAEEQLKNRIGVPPTDGGPPPPPGSPPGGPPAEPSELDKARLQREQHNMEIARQRALRETAATDLALAKAEAQKAKLAAQQAAPTFKDPTAQRLFEISQAQQAAKTQPPMMGQPGFQPSAPVAPPSVQSLDQAFATSVAPPVVQTAPAASVPPPETETKKTGGRPPKQAIAPDEEKLTKGQQAMKKHLVSLYGNGPEALSAYNQVRDILGYTPEFPPGKGGSLQPEEKEKILQYRKENIAGPKINLTHEMKKAMKAGGGAAALMAIPGFANASTFKEAMGNIGEALLPIGMTASQLAPGTLYTPEEQREFARQTELRKQAERQKLGSPYRSVPPR